MPDESFFLTMAGLVGLFAVTAGNLVLGDLFYNTIRDAARIAPEDATPVTTARPAARTDAAKVRPRMAGKPPPRGR